MRRARQWFSAVAVLISGACGPSNPFAPSASGEWTGTYHIVDCSSQGGDFRHCAAQRQFGPVSGPYSLTLMLQQSGGAVSGTATIQSGYANATIPVTGTLDHGALALGGEVTIPGSGGINFTDRVRVFDWHTRVDQDGRRMTGTFQQETAGYYGVPDVRFTSVLSGEIITLARR
jgi:hypothetical protein